MARGARLGCSGLQSLLSVELGRTSKCQSCSKRCMLRSLSKLQTSSDCLEAMECSTTTKVYWLGRRLALIASSRRVRASGGCSCRQTWLLRVFVRLSLMLGDVLLFLYREVKRASDSDTPSIVGKLAPKSNMPRSLVQLLLPSRKGITRNKCFDCRSTVPWGCVSDGNWCTPKVGE